MKTKFILILLIVVLSGCSHDYLIVDENNISNLDTSKSNVTSDDDLASGNEIPDGCVEWFDGCNTCKVYEEEVISCTQKFCEPQQIEPARCLSY